MNENSVKTGDTGSIAAECGLRLRRVRMARNMSQQELADRMFTTPQNISRYEKEGISNIDTIHRLSEVLGYDLLQSESDTEGTVGEIGREIINVLVGWRGRIPVAMLVRACLYGLDMARATDEIFKLERIGLCVREQYTDLDGGRQDELFLTAKGAITWKNLPGSGSLEDRTLQGRTLQGRTLQSRREVLKDVDTYEKLLASDPYCPESADSWQDYLDRRVWEKKIRQLDERSSYRANYIQYLMKNFTSDRSVWCYPQLIPGESAYFDLLYSMAAGITRKELSYLMYEDTEGPDCMEGDILEEIEEEQLLMTPDFRKQAARELFDRYGIRVGDSGSLEFCGEDDPVEAAHRQAEEAEREARRREIADYDERLEKYRAQEIEQFEDEEATLNIAARIAARRPAGTPSPYPTEWFSPEEIRAYVRENVRPAETDEERAIDAALAEINELLPDTLAYYYQFPRDWEESGLAEEIRGIYGIRRSENRPFRVVPDTIDELPFT